MNNQFIGSNLTITDANLFGGVNYSFTVNPDIDLSVGYAPSAEVSFTTNALTTSNVGKVLAYQVKQHSDSAFRNVGVFTVSSITKNPYGKFEVVAYDNISKLDKNIDSYLDSLTYPITASSLFSGVCSQCGVTPASTTFTNSNFSVKKNWEGSGITGRQMLSWIAGLAGGFVYATSTGTIKIDTYTSNSTTIDNNKYSKLNFADYTIPAIDKVTVRQNLDDVGYSYGTGNNVIIIEGNPLLAFTNQSEIATAVQNIYNVVHAIGAYVPMTVNLFEDHTINAGQKITVNNFNTLVFNKHWKANGVVLDSTGNASRDNITTTVNSSVLTLKGKTHEIINNVDTLTSRITSAEGDISEISLDVSGVTARVTTAEGNISTLSTNVSGITTRVENAEGDITTLEQTASGLQTLVNGKVGNNEVISKINQSAELIKIQANKITLDGNVVMKSNLTDGTTSISGSNINTGVINADLITSGTMSAGHLKLGGNMNVYESLSSSTVGGTFGYTTVDSQAGIGMFKGNNGIIASGAGVRIKGTHMILSGNGLYGPTLPSTVPAEGTLFFLTE